MPAHVLETWKSPMWCAMKLARGLKTVRSMPRVFMKRSWLPSMDSRNSSSLILSSEAFGPAPGLPIAATWRLRHSSRAGGAVV